MGFQSLGSKALDTIDVGRIRSVRAVENWIRKRAYWERAPWVGRRSIGEMDVMDGVATNALAPAVMTALRVAGVETAEQVGKVEVEVYRANAIDSDDTTSIRITTVDPEGPVIAAALTLCCVRAIGPVHRGRR